MNRTFNSYEEAKSAAKPGDEIWVSDTRYEPAWAVMTTAEGDEYAREAPFKTYIHWETVRESQCTTATQN